MTFQSISDNLKTTQDIATLLTIIDKFKDFCLEQFSGSFDLSKGNPEDFMVIMGILSEIYSKIDSQLIEAGNEDLWFAMSKIAIELLMFKESNTFADATLRFNDQNKMAWFHKGRYYEKEKDYNQAEESFSKAQEIDPDFYEAWYQIASMYEKIDLEKAYQKYLEIVEKFPRSMSGWKRLEEVGGRLGHYEVAMRAQKVSFELSNDPNRKM